MAPCERVAPVAAGVAALRGRLLLLVHIGSCAPGNPSCLCSRSRPLETLTDDCVDVEFMVIAARTGLCPQAAARQAPQPRRLTCGHLPSVAAATPATLPFPSGNCSNAVPLEPQLQENQFGDQASSLDFAKIKCK